MKKILIAFLLFLQISLVWADESQAFKYELSIASLFRNEARFLKEWIEYHRLLGVEHFYLFNHLSEDDYLSVLQPYIDQGIVELEELTYEPKIYSEWTQLQTKTLTKAIKKSKNVTHWLAVIDTDEFIIPRKHKTIPDFLKDYEKYGGVMINWLMFGTSNVWEIPSDKLMIEQLDLRAPLDYPFHHQFKSIIQPSKAKGMKNAHYCMFEKPYYAVNSKFEPASQIYTGWDKLKEIYIKDIRINHYWTRDEKFLKEEKIERQAKRWKRRKEDTCEGRAAQMNVKKDNTIKKFSNKLKKRMKSC